MIELDGVFFKEIVEHALRELPNECCGVIAANGDGRPTKVFPARNIEASAERYRIHHRDLIRIQDEMDEEGWSLWAFFHSHTHTEAYPSDTDRREATNTQDWYPGVRYLIVSLTDRERPELRAFFLRDGDVEEDEVGIA
ncbi:MAG TPA: M67 family metallopeptidase [Actinomycetota bacterium]